MADEISVTIEFEYDPVKNAELGNSLSRVATESEESRRLPQLEHPAAIQAGSEDGGRSYLSIVASTIQAVKPGHTLFVWKAYFHPGLGRRFQNAVVTYKFSAPAAFPPQDGGGQSASQAAPLEVVAYAPRKSYGGCSRESRTASWTVELPLTFTGGGLVEAGVKTSAGGETSNEVEHAFTLTGTARGVPRRTTCVWTIEENSSTERGIPTEAQFAVVVRHSTPLQCEIRAAAKTAGGFFPAHHLRAKTPVGDCKKVIDPSAFAGRLFEYDVQGNEGLDTLLKAWTGEVAGSLLEFASPVIMS